MSKNKRDPSPEPNRERQKKKSRKDDGKKILPLSTHSSDDEIVNGGPIMPVRPRGGRPDHANRGTRGDDGAPASLTGLVPPSTPPRKRKKKQADEGEAFSPHTSRLVDFATHLPIHLQASPSRPTPAPKAPAKKKRRKNKNSDSDSDSEDANRPSLRLNRIQHLPDKGWVNAGSCHTTKAYQLFEDWKNDYSPDKYFQPRSINIIHASDPADRTKDIRARPFTLCWSTPDFRPPEGVPTDTPVPIFRILYSCLGHCTHGTSLEQADDSNGDQSQSGSETDSDDDQTKKKTKHLDPNSDKVGELNKLLDAKSIPKSKPPAKKCSAEVYSDDLDRVHFFQQGTHQEARPEYLDMSPHIRQCILEMSSLYNLPASSIKRRLLRVFEEDTKHPTPRYRCPTTAQVDNAVNYNRRKDRVFTDPLLNIGVFAEHNPDKIFYYCPPNYDTNPPTEFATGIQHAYGTQSALLYGGRHGIGYDTTWANMNENRAPVTIMTTIDHNARMVPCFAYLSANITSPTQVEFLAKAKQLVEKMARDLLNGSVQVAQGLTEFKDELLAQARYVGVQDRHSAWQVLCCTHLSPLTSFTVFPGIIVRICQFHVMQAILRWERDHGPGGNHLPRPALSLVRKHQLLFAVRELQRCRLIDRWPAYTARFRQRLEALAEGSATTADHLWGYFEANWFTEEWLMYWTDMGLPAGANRDGMLSTNNWTERAFKTFNQVFLGNRTNKSAYRLVLILANEWFQYYQAWPPQTRVNKEALDMAIAAHQLWSSTNAVQPFVLDDGRRAWRVAA
ncbi:hypothetical protein C8R46DRAFT_1331939 [Mycena filopes]|nr:hypothetical protein C8R46DRAFT_1331939 [Mycena filopes]